MLPDELDSKPIYRKLAERPWSELRQIDDGKKKKTKKEAKSPKKKKRRSSSLEPNDLPSQLDN